MSLSVWPRHTRSALQRISRYRKQPLHCLIAWVKPSVVARRDRWTVTEAIQRLMCLDGRWSEQTCSDGLGTWIRPVRLSMRHVKSWVQPGQGGKAILRLQMQEFLC